MDTNKNTQMKPFCNKLLKQCYKTRDKDAETCVSY